MNTKEMEREMAKTHLVFKRVENAEQMGRRIAKYAKKLKGSAGGLANFLLYFLDDVAPIITRSKMSKALRESSIA